MYGCTVLILVFCALELSTGFTIAPRLGSLPRRQFSNCSEEVLSISVKCHSALQGENSPLFSHRSNCCSFGIYNSSHQNQPCIFTGRGQMSKQSPSATGQVSTHSSTGYELLSCLGSNLRLQCESNVTCNDRVQWRRILDDRTFEGHALQLRNVHQTDSGTYQCEVVDRHGRMRVKREVVLTVQFPPIITVPNKPSSVQEDHLECSSEAVPRATIKWYKGSLLLHPSSLSYSILSESSHCTTRSILFFNSSSLIGQGAAMFENYTCVAENDHGSSSATLLFEAFLDDVSFEEVPEEKRRFNVTGFIVGMLPPLFISFYIIVKLGYRSRYAEERGEDDGYREEPFFISY